MIPGIQDLGGNKKISKTMREFLKLIKSKRVRIIFCLFSGGRDSLVVLHLSKRVSEQLGLEVKAIYVDTTISTPGNDKYVQNVCKSLRVELIMLRPRHDYFTYVKKWGFPTATRRWCCYHLKIEPMKIFFRSQNTANAILVDGIRREESPRRKSFPKIGFHKHFKMLCYHPIFEWSKDDVVNYIRCNKLPENPLYEIFPRATECWCPAFKSIKQFVILKEHFPELFQKMIEAEASLQSGGSGLYKNGRRIYFREL